MQHKDSGHNEHSHGGHGPVHAPKSFGAAFASAMALNLGLVLAELVFGFLSNSFALISDGVHNFSDVLGLLLRGCCFRPFSKLRPAGGERLHSSNFINNINCVSLYDKGYYHI
jgi:hypothetical protein